MWQMPTNDPGRVPDAAELVARLLDDHQRMESHHADMCQLCMDAAAFLAASVNHNTDPEIGSRNSV